MTRLKKFIVLLGVTGSTMAGFSCTNTLLREGRDAAFSAFGMFVETQALNALNGTVAGG